MKHLSDVPLKAVYLYTSIQLACLCLLCVCGLYPQPYFNLMFPVLLSLLIPLRVLCLAPLFGAHIDRMDRNTNQLSDH